MSRINTNPNPKRTLSQKKRILLYLQSGGRLTPLQALEKFGTTKLATRVSELINEEGHSEIQKERVWVTTADGAQTQVMSYFIA